MENDKNITIKGLIDAYGKDKAAMIITKTVRQTIITTQQKMRNAKPMYAVLLKDPIAGKLIIETDHVLNLQFIGKDGKRRNLFTESEIKTMRRNMPGFDKYYEVRRGGFENE